MTTHALAAHDDRGDGPPVVLIHSFPLDRRMWEPQIGSLSAAGFRVLSMDLPGFGATPLPSHTDPSLDVYCDAVQGVLDHLGVKRCTLVGLSLGGYVALRLASRGLDPIDALVLADTRAGGDSPAVRAGRLVNLSLVRGRGTVALIEKMVPHLLAASTGEGARSRVRSIGGAQSPEGVSFALLAMRDREDATPTLAGLGVPALLIVGEHDAITPPAEMRAFADALPDARLVELPGCGHLSSMEAPDGFNDALIEFLSRVYGVPRH